MEAVNRFYLEDGHLDSTKNFKDENVGKENVIYEVVRIIKGKALFLAAHLKRLEKSFELMDRSFSYEYNKIEEYIERVVGANDNNDGNIKITYNINEDSLRVFYVKHNYPNSEMYENGVKTILYRGERKNPNAKVVDLEFREKVNSEMKKENAFEAILVNDKGLITEGSKSNIFLIKDNKLFTSKVEEVLPGVTRAEIIKIAKEIKLNFEEKEINYKELESIEAMFICGTSPGILPISSVNNISMNVNNEIIRELMVAYNNIL